MAAFSSSVFSAVTFPSWPSAFIHRTTLMADAVWEGNLLATADLATRLDDRGAKAKTVRSEGIIMLPITVTTNRKLLDCDLFVEI